MSTVARRLVVLAVELLVVGTTAVASATPGTGVSSTTLAKGMSPGGIVVSSPEKTDVSVLEITIAPGGSTGWHYHDGPLVAVVKSGTLTRTLHDCSTEVTTPGDPSSSPRDGSRPTSAAISAPSRWCCS